MNFTPKKYTSKLNFEKKKITIPERRFRFALKIGIRPFWDVGRIFFLWKKKLTIVFFGVKFTGDYRNVAIISTFLRDHSQNSRKNQIFHRFFDFLPWSRNNYVMIPKTWWLPVNFTPKNYTSKLNFEKKKIFDPPKGSQVRSQNGKTTILGCRTDFVFLWKKIWP